MDEKLIQLSASLQLVDDLYQRWLADPNSVDETWRRMFAGAGEPAPQMPQMPQMPQITAAITPVSTGNGNGSGQKAAREAVARVAQTYAPPAPSVLPTVGPAPTMARGFIDATHAAEAHTLVNAYRVRGHLEANLDPLGNLRREAHPDLDPHTHGFTDTDYDRLVSTGGLRGTGPLPLRQLIRRLRETYCGTIGVEFMHIAVPERRRWLQERMEPSGNHASLDAGTRNFILEQLIAATELERFIDAKYVGSKRFSLEGGETLIPLLHLCLEHAGEHGVEDAVLGMAHRGRLNVLVNLLGMSPESLFAEFEDIDPASAMGGGDVKYHLGYSNDHVTRAGHKIHLSLSFNPSHLEAVDPVVVGRVRAKQRRRRDVHHEKVLGILIHGDAAFAGQGLVAEVLNLSDLHGYRTGGTVHIIVNNQIGFTTSPTEARSTPYCTDVAKMTQIPIFHVNGDDPEAVAHVIQVAMDYRRTWRSDVVIDMFCFRRHGHNEIDEPSFTQPLLYDRIKRHPATYELYGEQLAQKGVTTRAQQDAKVKKYHDRLGEELSRARTLERRPRIEALGGVWSSYKGGAETSVPDVETAFPKDELGLIAQRISSVPAGFSPHPKVVRLLETRAAMGRGERPLDWAMGEAMAFGTLLWDGHLVRMTGQDCRRGTFSQRHAVVVDIRTGSEYTPLHHIRDGQGQFRIYDSSLSEAAVLGFEFGYSLDYPDGLIMWEAQFGDFANGAQVILDQFISSSEDRWHRLSGVVLLLPHGYEGQGPEHSSARLERYLQLAAEDNWQICQPTTPAQIFHLLRRQVLRKWRKPLIILEPKSMLRLPAATSPMDDLARGRFERVLADPESPPDGDVECVMVCSGKVYYELAEERRKRKNRRVAIVRLEQLFPLQEELLARHVDRYAKAREIVWVQEEPLNMGAFGFLYRRLRHLVGDRRLRVAARPESASPATGSAKAHMLEQRHLFDEAFG